MYRKIHILGASGSGTSTLGIALAKALPHRHLDTDDYFWATKFTKQRPVPERVELMKNDLAKQENWILSGAVCGWGEQIKPFFDLVIFLYISQEIRMKRLRQREYQRYGKEMLAGGSKYEQVTAFLDWAALYDQAGMEVRSRRLHEHWLSDIHCPVLRIEGDYSVQQRVENVLDYLSKGECKKESLLDALFV